jgi:hypothetical protein
MTERTCHLVWLCVTSFRLQVQDLFNAVSRKDMVTPADALGETHATEKVSKLIERDGRIGSALENTRKQLIGFRHEESLPHCATVA